MPDDAWREATAGFDPRAAADALSDAGFLRRGAGGERKTSVGVAGGRMWMWVVRRELLAAANHPMA